MKVLSKRSPEFVMPASLQPTFHLEPEKESSRLIKLISWNIMDHKKVNS